MSFLLFCLKCKIKTNWCKRKQIYFPFPFVFQNNALIYIQDANDLAVQQYLNSNYTPRENTFVGVLRVCFSFYVIIRTLSVSFIWRHIPAKYRIFIKISMKLYYSQLCLLIVSSIDFEWTIISYKYPTTIIEKVQKSYTKSFKTTKLFVL